MFLIITFSREHLGGVGRSLRRVMQESCPGLWPLLWAALLCPLPCGDRALTQSHPSALCSNRYALLRKSKERQGLDGLNNLNYFANITYDALYKNITVNLTPELAQVTEY